MKKRILALALAGTTAFSVFGAAISANAATSTDVDLKVDAYMSYTPVAKSINVVATDSKTQKEIIDSNGVSPVIGGTIDSVANHASKVFTDVQDYVKYTYNVKEAYEPQTKYTFTPSATDVLNYSTTYKKVTLCSFTYTNGNTYVRVNDKFDYSKDSTKYKDYNVLDGDFYVLNTAYTGTVDAYGQLNGATVYYTGTLSADATSKFAAAVNSGVDARTVDEYEVQASDKETLVVKDNVPIVSGDFAGRITAITGGYTYKKYNGSVVSCTASELLGVIAADYAEAKTATEYTRPTSHKLGAAGPIDAEAYAKLDEIKDYTGLISIKETITSSNTPSIKVGANSSDTGWDEWDEWTFNGDMTGETTVSPYKVTTSVNYGTGAMTVTKTATPTIYAYDFLYTSANAGSASVIANSWNNGTLSDVTNAIGTSELKVQTGRGLDGYGIRYETIVNWETFLNELSIYQDGYYYSIKTLDEFKSIYADRFYSDPVFDAATGIQIDVAKVDLYNINGLLTDIWNLRTPSAYENANTSQMIYLMQQYDKYIGDYIDQEEVSTDEWGDLLVSLLNSVTADDFKTALDYKRYTAKVDTLVADYENALTAGQVKAAEQAMYDMLTSSAVPYYASKTADKAALAATIDGLYFNVKTAPTQYSVGLSTVGNAEFTNYNYYVSVAEFDKTSNAYVFSGKMTQGYYSLYPMQDYIDNTGAKNAVYTGNATETVYADAKATDEYEWFWNVYQLAANMKKSNKFQGSVDAVNDALNEAVADLSATTTPTGTDTAALTDTMDKYADKIDTDYNKDYYDNYTAAITYANDNAEGKWQTRIATMINGVAGEALTYQGTQVTVTKNDMKTVEEAIKNGETALKAIKEDADYNAAQVTALNKAIDQAEYLVSLYEGTYSKLATQQSVNKQYTYLTGDKDQMVKSDLTKAIEAIDAAINYSEIVMGWSKNDAGKWMYGTEEGYLNDGWHQVDGGKTWFYFNADGTAKQSEWWNDNGTWYWFNSNCGAATGWAKVDGEWYFFKGNNAMKTGWEKVDGNWYYMASSGKMVTGWCEVNGKWYYFSKESNSLGQMLYSTTVDGYKLGADGAWIK